VSVVELEQLIAALPFEPRAAARRTFAVTTATGTLVAPEAMRPWIEKHFGSVDAVQRQTIVRVTDRVTLDGALFNGLRATRPMALPLESGADVRAAIRSTEGDPFCHLETGTPADEFGRIRGAGSATASNVAKYDGNHGVLVFDAHDPLVPMNEAAIADHFRTARSWAVAAFERDPTAPYYFLLWNCLWRAGSSIVHGHMQMTTTRGMHYPKVERLRRAAAAYAAEHQRDYFDDLWLVHEALGLGVVSGAARAFATLTPVKEREIVILGPPGALESSLAAGVAHALTTLRGLGVVAHDLALYLPPLTPDGTDWQRFPAVARLVDRGDPDSRTSDIGSMELYAASVVSADPFAVGAALRAGPGR